MSKTYTLPLLKADIADSQGDVFTPEALAAIAAASSGQPVYANGFDAGSEILGTVVGLDVIGEKKDQLVATIELDDTPAALAAAKLLDQGVVELAAGGSTPTTLIKAADGTRVVTEFTLNGTALTTSKVK